MGTPWARIAAFFAIATAATYSLGYFLKNLRGDGKPSMSESAATANLLMLVPGLVAVLFVALVVKRPWRATLGLRWRPNRWWLVAWILPAVMAAGMIAMRLLAPGAEFTPPRNGPWAMLPVPQPWGALLAGLIAGATICLPGALGEELAWRGYLQHEVRHLGFWRASLVIAVAWIGWHLPPVLLAGQGLGLSVNLLMTTPLIVFVRRQGGSVIAAALFHGTMSGTWLIPGVMVTGGGSFARILAVGPGVLCLLLVLLAQQRQSRLESEAATSQPADPIAI